MITKHQYRTLMSKYQETGSITASAMKADMSRPTARKYVAAAQPPNELQAKHTWRTREGPLAQIWPQAEVMLAEALDVEAKVLFEYLRERTPGAVQEKHLRTFQRRVKLWRLQFGPDQEVFFPQAKVRRGEQGGDLTQRLPKQQQAQVVTPAGLTVGPGFDWEREFGRHRPLRRKHRTLHP